MAKIKVRSGRGTGTMEVDTDDAKWSGKDFKQKQAARQEASKNKYVSVGRGTGKIKFGDIATTKIQDTKNMWVSSGRGTGRRKL